MVYLKSIVILPLFCLFLERDVDVFELWIVWDSEDSELKFEDGKKSEGDPVMLALVLLLSRATFARGIFTTTRGSTTPMVLFLLQKYD